MIERFGEFVYKAAAVGMTLASIISVVMWTSIIFFGEPKINLGPDSIFTTSSRPAKVPPAPTAEDRARDEYSRKIDQLNRFAATLDVTQPAPVGK